MPRDGSGIYTYPPGSPGIPDTTIESAKYNAYIADIQQDLNLPRPVIAGGTGASSAAEATTNLKAVSYGGAQTLTDAEKLVARTNIAATSSDAMAHSGMQLNGSCDVSQERGLGSPITGSGHVMDGWRVSVGGTMVVASQQASVSALPGLSNMLHVLVTTGQTSLGVNDTVIIYNWIEGYRTARLGWGTASAQSITLGFWTAHTPPGIYSVVIKPTGSTRSYCTTYTQAASNVWQYNVINIPGDVAGTWNAGNGVGMYVMFTMAAGINVIAPAANVWGANFSAAPGQVNGVAAVSNQFRFTGLTVLPGTQAPTAAQSPLIMRPYDQELLTCQRYYQHSWNAGIASKTPFTVGGDQLLFGHPTGIFGQSINFIPKRAVPTVNIYDALGAAGKISVYSGSWINGGTPNLFYVKDSFFYLQHAGAGTTYTNFGYVADARL